jgi:NADP-dependent 3-hydroxy acid dehydrogenase YdfG
MKWRSGSQKRGFDVIAAVEIYAQVQTLKREAAARGVSLQVEKLDVTNNGDRKKALSWNVEILINNAGVLEGGPSWTFRGATCGENSKSTSSGRSY